MHAENLSQLLQRTAKQHPDNSLTFYKAGAADEDGITFTHSDFLNKVEETALLLRALPLGPGDIVVLHFDSQLDNLLWFWAVTVAGLVPALSTPFSNDVEQRKKHIAHLDGLLGRPVWLISETSLPQFQHPDQMTIRTVETLARLPESANSHAMTNGSCPGSSARSGNIAALMLTSGSTGMAKAVGLTHANILDSVAGKSKVHGISTGTAFFNWIGADHVANLTEIHIHALSVGASQVHVQAADVVAEPLLFLRLIEKHGVAYTFAPNFFLVSLERALRTPAGVDFASTANLSCLRTIVTGGEAAVVSTCAALTKTLETLGCPSNVVTPGFGMTETCAGSIYSQDCPHRDVEKGNAFAALGRCVEGMEMRIVDDDGCTVGPEVAGNLQVRGPVVFSRYYNNEQATADAFDNGWFATGDHGFIDSDGQLNLTGRARDDMIINGVKYSSEEVEASLQDVTGTKPSFTVAFSFRADDSDTESLVVVYCATYHPDDTAARIETNDALSRVCMLRMGVRALVIPLEEKVLQKTTLGKLSRFKIRRAFIEGEYQPYLDADVAATEASRGGVDEQPANEMEMMIQRVLLENFAVGETVLGVRSDFFARGMTSTDIIRLKSKLQKHLQSDIPTLTVLTNPTIRSLATALNELSVPRVYHPRVVLQSKGTRTPLWLIHPGLGEILVFLGLASYFEDRPIYTLRARGFEEGETFFTSIEETVTTYVARIKESQPTGPYAIAGYSFGSMLAFEAAKVLRSQGDNVSFLGVFNLPPHIKWRMRQLDWTNCLLHLAYFLEFITEIYASALHPILQQHSREEVLALILAIAPKDRMAELGLDGPKLARWTELAFRMQQSAVDYEPSGMVDSMDVFCANPLAVAAKDIDDWKMNHLAKWQDFTTTEPNFHEVEGAHYTMLGPEHVQSFQKTLKAALDARGI